MAIRTSAIDVIVRMRGSNTFAAQAKKSAAELEAMGVKGATAASRLAIAGQKMQAFGASMTKFITVPIAAGAAVATKMAIDYQGSMERLATQAGDTQRQTDSLSKALVKFSTSGQTAFGPQAFSEAAFHVASQGFHSTADAMNVLKAAADGAEIGGSDLTDTTKVLGQTMKAFQIPADQARRTMSQFNTIVGHGDMTMSDLVTGMQTGVVPVFAAANLQLKDLGGAMDVLTSRNFSAAKAGTGLKMAVAALLSPSDKAAGIMKGLGIDTGTLADTLQHQGLPAAIDYLNKQLDASGVAADKLRPQLLSAFGGGRTGPAVLTLIQHAGALRQAVRGATPDISAFDKAVARWADTPAGKLERAKAQLEGTAIMIGQQLAPVVATLATKLSAVFSWFSKLPAPVRSLALDGFLLAAALGPVIWAFGTLLRGPFALLTASKGVILFFQALIATMAELDVGVITATSAMVGFDIAVLAIPAAIAAVVAGLVILYLKVKWFRDKVNAVFNFFKDNPLALLLIPVVGPFLLVAREIITHFGTIKSVAITVFKAVSGAVRAVIQVIQKLIDKITGPLKDAFNTLKGPAAAVAGAAGVTSIRDARPDLFGPVHGVVAHGPHTGGGTGSPGNAPRTLHLPGRALGGPVMPGGTALVGERGPELASFPFGAQITDANKTAGLLSRGRDNLPPITIPIYLDGKILAESTLKAGQTAKARK